MARYARMLVNRGQGPKGRIVSEASFRLMSTPYIKAEEFSPTASYGYGIAVDTLEGHTILRHTGGMVAFASSIHVDLDGGVAAFASINAMQGYRPTAVTEYAVRLMNAQKESKALPETPVIADPLEAENAAEYAGSFTSGGDRKLEFAIESGPSGKRLMLMDGSGAIPLQHAGGDRFLSTKEGRFASHAFLFGRVGAGHASDGGSSESGSKPPVIEVSYGGEWYTNSSYTGPRSFNVPAEYVAYAGHYVNDGAWGGEARVYILKGQLFAEGDPLTPLGGALFRAGEEAWSPETAEFLHVYEGKARLMKLAGMDFWRVEVE
jgi:hypothetical protein